MSPQLDLIPLGATDLRVTPLGLGIWQWGETWLWGYGKDYGEADLKPMYEATLAAGINFVDTAEIYGQGRSEQLLGGIMRETNTRDRVVLATKFAPLPWRLTPGRLIRALRESLNRMGLSQVDLYQIHFPYSPISVEMWMGALADAVEGGLTRAVGVSNFTPSQTVRAHAALARRGVPLASNQVEYSLLDRKPETGGLIKVCRDLEVTVIAYSPIAKGVLSGKYTPDHVPAGMLRLKYTRNHLTRIQPLLGVLKAMGEAHGGKTPVQVALNWLMCKDVVPIPGAKNLQQAEENFGALGWRLTDEEVARLDEVSEKVKSNK
jgi:aryl-alcohol dehydrogenase-like predicted oxidoreductase